VKRDDLVVIEVMVDALDRPWWSTYKGDLERLFRQEQIVVRAQDYEPL
jgi:predicted nucleotidyltransferase